MRVAVGARARPAAAIYCRISDDRTGEEAGVKRQEQDCRALAAARGWDVMGLYVDNDISASSLTRKVRPQYERLLEAMRDRTVDAVVIWHEDRLHRRPRELEGFIDLANAQKIQLATVTGDINLATPEGRLRARMLGSVGAYESEHKAARIRRKHLELAQLGKLSGGGPRPFGYEEDRVTVRPAEAKLIREAAHRVLAGESLRSMVREWNASGKKTSVGNPWIVSTLKRVLISGRIAGWREHGTHTSHAELTAKGEWDAIIPLAEHKRLRALLTDPARRLNGNSKRYLLTGFLRCGHRCDAKCNHKRNHVLDRVCGSNLVARPRGDGTRCYVCALDERRSPLACNALKTLAEPLEDLITAMVLERVDSPKLAETIATRRGAAGKRGLQQAVDAAGELEGELEELARDYGLGRISRRSWFAAKEPMERRLAVARESLTADQRLAAVDGFSGKTGALREAWPTLSLDRQRAILSVVIEKVTIGPAVRGLNRFDPRRIDVSWRF